MELDSTICIVNEEVAALNTAGDVETLGKLLREPPMGVEPTLPADKGTPTGVEPAGVGVVPVMVDTVPVGVDLGPPAGTDAAGPVL